MPKSSSERMGFILIKMNLDDKLDLLKEQVNNMSSGELQSWCNSQECYDYMNR